MNYIRFCMKKIEQYIHSKSLEKMWKPFTTIDTLVEDPYLVGPDHTVTLSDVLVSIPVTQTVVKRERETMKFHEFVKLKVVEYAKTHPTMSKKERYKMVIADWHVVKN